MQAVMRAEPQVVINQLTALTGATNIKHFDRVFALTNRLRTEGTDHLLEAARAAGARRFIVQSYANRTYERRGGPIKTENDPFDPDPPSEQTESLRAIRHLERAVLEDDGVEGIVLRYANFYGPGTSYAADGVITTMVRKRRFPVVGDGAGIWSFVHIDDAAAAAAAAVQRGGPGVYNVADDEPAPAAEWLPALAAALGAKPPRHVPVWLGRVAIGEVGVSMMTRIRGISNAKARRELGWTPAHPSWRQGFRAISDDDAGPSIDRPRQGAGHRS
jgi:nucleoside-diphosphate-sugar epimerase